MSTPNQPPYGQPPQGQPGPGGPPPGQPPPGQPPPGQPPQGQSPYGQPQPGFTPPNYGGQSGPASYPTPPPPGGYPQQPGYPGAPYAQPQPGQPGGYPGGPGGYPGGPGPVQPPAKKGSGARIGIIIGAIVLALVIIGVGAAALINRNNDSASDPIDPPATGGTGGGPSGGTSTLAPPPVSTKADESVKAYLEALAGSQAAVALSLAKDQPVEKTFLTDAVLAESNKRAPLTAITVSPPDSEYDSSIEATYKLGEQQVNESFTVQKVGDNYLLYNVAQDVSLETIRSRTLPLLINGLEVKADKVALFPGSYAFTSGTPNISYGDGTLVVKSPNDYPSAYDLRPEITDAGTKAFGDAAKAKLASCVKQAKLKPAGCPFLNIRNLPGQKLDESTIKRKITEDPFSNLEPRIDYQDPSIAEAGITVRWSAAARGTQNGRSARFEIPSATDYTTARAKMAGTEVKVTFSS